MTRVNLPQCFIPGDEVAIVPHADSEPTRGAGDGDRLLHQPGIHSTRGSASFDAPSRRGLNTSGWIVLATDEHRDALAERVQ